MASASSAAPPIIHDLVAKFTEHRAIAATKREIAKPRVYRWRNQRITRG